MSLSHYHGLGGVQGALARHADTALTQALQVSGLTEREVLAGLTRLVTVDETGRRSRRRITLTSLAEPVSVALQVFVDHRLLLSDTDDEGQVWLTVVHEALLTGWEPLNTATADITVALRTARAVEQAAVEQAAAEWASADRPEHFLATLGMTSDGGSHNPTAPPSSRSTTRLGHSSTPPGAASTPSRSANGVSAPGRRYANSLKVSTAASKKSSAPLGAGRCQTTSPTPTDFATSGES